MAARSRRWLYLGVLFIGVAVQPGNLGSVDTSRRLQVTHSLWTSAPPVARNDAEAFGIRGRRGIQEAWYGIGQSLLMLPADIVVSGVGIEGSPRKEHMRVALVEYLTFPAVSVAVVACAGRLLANLGFTTSEMVPATVLFFLGSSLLPYTQINQENSLLAFSTLGGLAFGFQWLHERKAIAALLSGLLFSFGILTRLPSLLDALLTAGLLAWVSAPRDAVGIRRLTTAWGRRDFLWLGAPVAAALLIDRLYQWYRFGDVAKTYIHLFGEQARLRNPLLPASFPFSGNVRDGLLGPFFSPDRSIFLFEPFVLLALILAILTWRRLPEPIQGVIIYGGVLICCYAGLYARYYNWPGASCWGNRFLTTPTLVTALVGSALWIRHRDQMGRPVRTICRVVIGFAVAVQASSLVFSYNLEEIQLSVLGPGLTQVGLRWANILGVLVGLEHTWGLRVTGVSDRFLTPNFLPFLARSWLGDTWSLIAQVVWGMLVVAGIAAFWRAVMSAREYGGEDGIR